MAETGSFEAGVRPGVDLRRPERPPSRGTDAEEEGLGRGVKAGAFTTLLATPPEPASLSRMAIIP